MPWPDEPCETCPRPAKGLSMPCRAMRVPPARHGNARMCELARTRDDYARLLCDESPEAQTPGASGWSPAPPDPAEAARLRRAAKPRIALGVKQDHG